MAGDSGSISFDFLQKPRNENTLTFPPFSARVTTVCVCVSSKVGFYFRPLRSGMAQCFRFIYGFYFEIDNDG